MIRKTAAGRASEPAWFRSSHSGGTNGESCVEIATTPGTIRVRDSKDVEGPRLAFSPETWSAFVPYASED